MTKRTSGPNRLGAMALVLSDRFTSAIEEELGIGGSAASALMTIGVEKIISVEQLAKQLGLGQSSMVRAVQALEKLGLVYKETGIDRRTLTLKLTRKGKHKVKLLLKRRSDILDKAWQAVPPSLRDALLAAIDAILISSVEVPADKFPICRLCDEDGCGGYSDCPVERGAMGLEEAITVGIRR